MTTRTTLRIAVVGAGPVGLALGLHAARLLPRAQITLFDARPEDRDVSGDPRTLALSLGSVQLLQRLGAWPEDVAEPILEVHVSQAPPSWAGFGREAAVRIRAADEGVAQLGAVLAYGPLVATMQRAWQVMVMAEPQRLRSRFGLPVQALLPLPSGVQVDAGIVEDFDLAIVAEGGVFAEQARRALVHDYRQTAWVGTVTLSGAPRGMAFERFTRNGPAALLPLRSAAGQAQRAALVWCVPSAEDPVLSLSEPQRLALLRTVFAAEVGVLQSMSPLKAFALGLNAEPSLVQGRSVRIGNAAQTLHPVAGQGLNLGLRDVVALVAALRFSDDLDAALRRVNWERAPDRWSMIATTDFLARSFTWNWPGIAALRGLGLVGLQNAMPVKSWLARQMMFGRR